MGQKGLLTKSIGYIGYRISGGINRKRRYIFFLFFFLSQGPNNMQNMLMLYDQKQTKADKVRQSRTKTASPRPRWIFGGKNSAVGFRSHWRSLRFSFLFFFLLAFFFSFLFFSFLFFSFLFLFLVFVFFSFRVGPWRPNKIKIKDQDHGRYIVWCASLVISLYCPGTCYAGKIKWLLSLHLKRLNTSIKHNISVRIIRICCIVGSGHVSYMEYCR